MFLNSGRLAKPVSFGCRDALIITDWQKFFFEQGVAEIKCRLLGWFYRQEYKADCWVALLRSCKKCILKGAVQLFIHKLVFLHLCGARRPESSRLQVCCARSGGKRRLPGGVIHNGAKKKMNLLFITHSDDCTKRN